MSDIQINPVRGVSFQYGALSRARNVLFQIVFFIFSSVVPVAAQTVVIAALGDSLTQGYGLPAEDGLVAQLQSALDEKGAEVTLINAGVSGDTTAGGLARVDWTLTPEVGAMIVALGGNDLMRGIDPSETRANLRGILEAAETRNLPVLLVGIEGSNNFGADYRSQFEAIFPELATEFDVPLYPDILATLRGELHDPKALGKYMQGDAVHPNKDGVAMIAQDLTPYISNLAEQARAIE